MFKTYLVALVKTLRLNVRGWLCEFLTFNVSGDHCDTQIIEKPIELKF